MKSKYLKEFEKLNTTAESIYNLSDLEVLIILKDGSNLTSWDEVEDKKDIIYVSEDLSAYTDLSGKYEHFESLRAIVATGVTEKVTDMSDMFSFCFCLKDISSLSLWDVSGVVSMNGMFNGCISLDNLDALRKWNVSNVKYMGSMFENCVKLEDLSGLANWNVCEYTDIVAMFFNCKLIENSSVLSNWEVFNCTPIEHIFETALKLRYVPLE